jgi:type 1 glutamine amidotransferase
MMHAWQTKRGKFIFLLGLMIPALAFRGGAATNRILCFTYCAGYVHSSIDSTVQMLTGLGDSNGFSVDKTNNAADINTANLAKYDALVLVDNTGQFLSATQQTAFQTYVHSGKGIFAIHAAADAFHDAGTTRATIKSTWQYYSDMIGAIFVDHPSAMQTATIDVEDHSNPSTKNLPAKLSLYDEWYNFTQSVRSLPGFTVLMSLDETSYNPLGYNGNGPIGDHTFAWYHLYDNSRVIYTGLGHNSANLTNNNVRGHFLGCVQYAAGYTSTPVVTEEHGPIVPGRITVKAVSGAKFVIMDRDSRSAAMRVSVCSVHGVRIRESVAQMIAPGMYLVNLENRIQPEARVAAGSYIVSVFSEGRQTTGRIIVTR